jgi:hypothetical protein
MALRTITDVFSEEQLRSLRELPEVSEALQKINAGATVVYFTVELTADIKATLLARLGLDLSSVSKVPMRWIKGDTVPHVDVGTTDFTNTFLMYLSNSPGAFVVGEDSYPIAENTGFVFDEGLRHETLNTGTEPRLLLGPMSEGGLAVGANFVFYYSNQADALTTNPSGLLLSTTNYTIVSVSGYTQWRIASNSTPSPPASSQLVVYNVGDTLIDLGSFTYYLYPVLPCFLEGSRILCQVDGKEEYLPVETLRKGTLVKTSRDGFKAVELVGKRTIANSGTEERTEDRLYKCTPSAYPELTEDLVITGCHSILVDTLTDVQRAATEKSLGKIFVTDRKYRLMAHIDERAEPWASAGDYTVWHFALENTDITMNYGVYANGGLLVETCSINFLKNKSNMTLIE